LNYRELLLAGALALTASPKLALAQVGQRLGASSNPPATTAKVAPPTSTPVASSTFSARLYGFVEADGIYDSTRSYNDLAGNANLARRGTFAGEHDRLQTSVRNSRFGLKFSGPHSADIKTSATLETDFMGNQPPNVSEAAFFNNPSLRLRHAMAKLETPYLDVLVGQYWELFGWQSYFHPNTVEIQGVPGQVYSRTMQLRLSHVFKSTPLDIELALAGARPLNRDGVLPDGQAGVRFLLNGWKGLHTAGSTSTGIDSAAIGVSGLVRQFKLTEFSATPQSERTKVGAALSIDALVPILPATDANRANAITLTASFVNGTGIADQYTGLTGGIGFPALPSSSGASSAAAYVSNIDSGLVTYQKDARLHAINWRSYLIGLQYYLPPTGSVWVSANVSRMKSTNIESWGEPGKVFSDSFWADANVFWDIDGALRIGAEYAHFRQKYGDGSLAQNSRLQLSAFYLF
jgi:hypothetical protein